MSSFLQNYGIVILLVILLAFMFWSSRRRQAKQKAEREAKSRQTVPGAEVLLQGGLYGTIIAYDPDNLDEPAIVEIAPGVDIRVHSQAILRIVTPSEETSLDDQAAEPEPRPHIESPDETARRLHGDAKDTPEA